LVLAPPDFLAFSIGTTRSAAPISLSIPSPD
jgi:hypothetical protein